MILGTHSIGRLKQWRGVAMRTDKLAIHYEAAVHIAAVFIWATT
jgi:transposase